VPRSRCAGRSTAQADRAPLGFNPSLIAPPAVYSRVLGPRAVIERAFPAAVIERWDGGHLLHEEEPDRALALIRDWLLRQATRATRHD
jgi:hypothetical protein